MIATDGAGATAEVPFTLEVEGENDPPSFTPRAAVLDEDIAVDATDAVVVADAISAGPFESGEVRFRVVVDTGEALLTANPTISADGRLTLAPAANVSGDVVLRVTPVESVDGIDVDGDTQEVRITITPVNDPPTFTAAPLQTREDVNLVAAVVASDVSPGPEESGAVTIDVELPAGQTLVTAVTRVSPTAFDFTLASDENGVVTFDVVGTDDLGAVTRIPTTLTVAAVNDPPRFTRSDVTILEDGSVVGVTVATDIAPGPANEGGGVRFVVDKVDGAVFDPAIPVTIGSDGRFTGGRLLENANGTANLQITALDDEDAALTETVDVVVTPVNDLPVLIGPLGLATPLNTTKSFDLQIVDIDGDGTAVAVAGPQPAFATVASAGNRVTITPTSPTATGRATVTLIIIDGVGVTTRAVSVAVLGPQPSCFHYRAQNASVGDAVYALLQPQESGNGCATAGGCLYTAFCDMEDGDVDDDGGGWTLVLKADGNGDKWEFDDNRWTDANILEEDPTASRRSDLIVGQTNGADGEAKLRAYLHVKVDELRIGFAPHTTNSRDFTFVPGNMSLARQTPATSMRALMSANSEGFVAVNPPNKADWLGSVSGFTLQDNCNLRGLNVRASQASGAVDRVRIDILSNGEDNCDTPDSYVGIGTDLTSSNVAGNRSATAVDQSRHGAVLVRSTDLTDVGSFASCDAVIAAGFVDADAIYLVGGQAVNCAP